MTNEERARDITNAVYLNYIALPNTERILVRMIAAALDEAEKRGMEKAARLMATALNAACHICGKDHNFLEHGG